MDCWSQTFIEEFLNKQQAKNIPSSNIVERDVFLLLIFKATMESFYTIC
jgi:hypothetical protein